MKKTKKKSIIVLCAIAVTTAAVIALTGAVMSEVNAPHIHSITELNRESHTIDSHDGATDRSTLELDYRSMQLLTAEDLGTGTAHYPRIKKLRDGSYILFYNSQRTKEDCLYIRSYDLVNWTEPEYIFEHDDKYNYATTDAVVLSNGDILACAAKKPSSWSAYIGNMEASTLVTRRSTDNGITWSEEKSVYTGMVWEPSLLELNTGEIQIYFTSTATYTELYGYNYDVRSSGSSIIRSYDGGYTWTPNVTAHNIDPKDPYGAWRVMQQKIGSFTVTDKYTGITQEVDWFNDQMPVAVQLNNGSIALVVESYLHFAPHPVNDGLYQLSVGYSYDNWATPLGRTEEGPADKLLNVDRAAGPYIRQFPSGEVIISHTNSTAKVEYKVCDPTAHILSKDFSINTGTSNLWSSSEINSGHRLIFVSDDGNNTADVEAQSMELGVCEMSLNHNLTAYSQKTVFDGDSNDWSENTEAIFVGSGSQAQCSVRSSYDSDNIYFLIEVLDDYLNSSDYIELRFATNTTSTTYYIIKADHTGIISENFPYAVDIKTYKKGTVGSDKDTDVGYMMEIKLKKSDLSKVGFGNSLYVMPILYNTDGTTTYDYDSISGADIKVKARTLCPMITYSGIRTYDKVYVSATGNDDATGNNEENPVLTLERAASILKGKGEIVVLDNITVSSDLHLKTKANSISIKGKSPSVRLDFSANLFAYSDILIDAITIYSQASGKFVYMQYNDLYIGKDVICKKTTSNLTMLGIIAGYFANNANLTYSELCSDKDCSIEINGGQWRYVRGGNRRYGNSAPLGHYSGDCTITINGGVFEATSVGLTDDVSSPTGMNSSSGNNTMIINGGRFVGAIYAQSRSGGIYTSADGFTYTPDYSGKAEIVFLGGVIEGGVHASQTLGVPASNISYPYNTHISISYLNALSDTVSLDKFDSVGVLAYGIPLSENPRVLQLDGADVSFEYYGGKIYLSAEVQGDVLVAYVDSDAFVYILDNIQSKFTETSLSGAVPKYIGTAVRTTGNAGLRFKSSLNLSSIPEDHKITKVGGIACFAENLTDRSGITFRTPKIGQSVAFDSEALVEKWYVELDNGDKQFTTVLVNFDENEYTKDVTYRPYVVFENDGRSYTIWGECVTKSVYSVSKQCNGQDSTNNFVQNIINVCEGKDNNIEHSFFD